MVSTSRPGRRDPRCRRAERRRQEHAHQGPRRRDAGGRRRDRARRASVGHGARIAIAWRWSTRSHSSSRTSPSPRTSWSGARGRRAIVRHLNAQERSLMRDLAILDVADRQARPCPAGDPATGRDRSRAGARRAGVPLRRAELRADPGGVEGPVPADAPARRCRQRRRSSSRTGSPSSPSTRTASR